MLSRLQLDVVKDIQEPPVRLRPPRMEDGAAIWRLLRESPVLDLNSAYLYLMMCRNFASTCVVADRAGALYGFATAYLLPARPDTLFLWQIGVSPDARGQGLASRMLMELLQRDACTAVTHLETTVSPSNAPSRALFRGLARRLDTQLQELPGIAASLFPHEGAEDGHEDEPLLRIGPFRAPRQAPRSKAGIPKQSPEAEY